MKRLLLLPITLFAITSMRGQTTLEEYRQAVIRYSWKIKMAAEERTVAAQDQLRAYTRFWPTLSLSGDFSVALRDHSGVKPWDFALQPEIIATLYGGGEVRHGYRSATLRHAASMAQEEFSELDIGYAAEYAYWNLSAMKLYEEATEHYVEIIGSLRTIILRRFEEGYTSKSDLLMIEARLSSAEYDLLRCELNYEQALHNFNILRGMESDLEVELQNSILQSAPLPQRISLEEILDHRPDFRAARLGVEQAKSDIKLAGAPFLPRIELGVRGIWQPDSPNRRGTTSIDGALFARISVPIFHLRERRHAIRSAEATARATEWALSELHDDILREERNGWSTLSESYTQIEAIGHNLEIAAENLELSTYSYQEGLSTILDVLQAQLDWIGLYTNAITARFNYAVARSAYLRITASQQ
uniref:TolC family protein n=1 Tax=Alistipes sp. TaxID=1872444 RepID=UPI004057A758